MCVIIIQSIEFQPCKCLWGWHESVNCPSYGLNIKTFPWKNYCNSQKLLMQYSLVSKELFLESQYMVPLYITHKGLISCKNIILDNWIIRLSKKNKEKLLQYSWISGNIGEKKCARIIKKFRIIEYVRVV